MEGFRWFGWVPVKKYTKFNNNSFKIQIVKYK